MMRIRTKYLLFVGLTHLIALLLALVNFRDNILLFIGSELVIICSLVIAWRLYQSLIQPINLLARGRDAIADKDFTTKFIKTGNYEMDVLIDVYNSMIDELRKERTVQEEQHLFLQKLVSTAPAGIVIMDYDENIIHANPKALEMLKMTESVLLSEQSINSNSDVLIHIKSIPAGCSKTITVSGFLTYKIQKSQFIDRGFPRQFVMIEELTSEILAAEKQVYGKVIRMMAHEVNNTIAPVNSIIQSALSNSNLWRTDEDSSIKQALEIASERNNNLASFVRNFADVVRLPLPHFKPFDINKLVRETGKLFEIRAANSHVKFNYIIPPSDWIIHGDSTQLEQVFINIIKNAIEAIAGNGEVWLVTDKANNRIIIKDSGQGVKEENLQQLFTPFFSTKPDGQGIGLTLVKEILVNHHFLFELKKDEEGYTNFIINFGD